MTQDSSTNAHHRLHALDLATGQDRVAPVEITGSYPGSGDNSIDGTTHFVAANFYEQACFITGQRRGVHGMVGSLQHAASQRVDHWL